MLSEAMICDGCNVREPFEHRCAGDGCECELCTYACDRCGVVASARPEPRGWYFGVPHSSDGIGDVLCPRCAPVDDYEPMGGDGYAE